jgi:hypothetical protein
MKLNLGDIENLVKYKTLLERNLSNVVNILDPKAIPMGKDWSWADLPYATEELVELLTK